LCFPGLGVPILLEHIITYVGLSGLALFVFLFSFLFFIPRVCGFLYSETLPISILSTLGASKQLNALRGEDVDTQHSTTLGGYIHSGWHSGLKSDFQDGKADCREQHLSVLLREPRSMCTGSIDCQ